VGKVGDKTSEIRKLFDVVTDGRLEWDQLHDVFDVAELCDVELEEEEKEQVKREFSVRKYEAHKDPAVQKQTLKSMFPEDDDQKAIDAFFSSIGWLKLGAPIFFILKLLPTFISNTLLSLFAPASKAFLSNTTQDWFANYSANPELLGVLSYAYGDFGLPPGKSSFAMTALLTEHFFGGGNYPRYPPHHYFIY